MTEKITTERADVKFEDYQRHEHEDKKE